MSTRYTIVCDGCGRETTHVERQAENWIILKDPGSLFNEKSVDACSPDCAIEWLTTHEVSELKPREITVMVPRQGNFTIPRQGKT